MQTNVLLLQRTATVARTAFVTTLRTASRQLGLAAPVIDVTAPAADNAPAPTVDAMVSWNATAGATLRSVADLLAPVATVTGGYTADALVHWDDAPGTRYPFTMVACSCRIPGIAPAQFVERYRQHAAVARVHHPTIRRYEQWFVNASLEGSRPCEAIALLHFDSAEDHALRLYRDEDSRAVVDADVARFLDRDRVLVFFTTERIN